MEVGLYFPNTSELEKQCELFFEEKIKFVELDSEILPSHSEKEVEKLSRILKERKIKVYTVHAPFGKDNDLSCPRAREREKALFLQREVMDKMEALGSKIIVIHPGEGPIKKEEQGERLRVFSQSLERLLFLAEEKRIKLAVENALPTGPGDRGEDLKNLVKRFNSPWLGICFDTGHAHVGGKLKEDFESVKDLILTFHLHDNDGIRDLHLQPPYGTIRWEEFILQFKLSPYQGPLIIECLPWGGAKPGWAKKEVELLFEGKLFKINSPSGYVKCPQCGHFYFKEKGEFLCWCTS